VRFCRLLEQPTPLRLLAIDEPQSLLEILVGKGKVDRTGRARYSKRRLWITVAGGSRAGVEQERLHSPCEGGEMLL
jgi:hypothetical protein